MSSYWEECSDGSWILSVGRVRYVASVYTTEALGCWIGNCRLVNIVEEPYGSLDDARWLIEAAVLKLIEDLRV